MEFKRKTALMLGTLLIVMALFAGSEAYGTRIKDIAYFLGTRPNMLVGYGLVVGLNGTGDNTNTVFTVNTLANLLDNLGIHVDPTQTKTKNVAAVMVTAKLPPFSRVGARIDVEASSIGDAKSLAGGTLLMTQLQGPDGKTYALAQGAVTTGGFAVGGASGSSVQKNHPTVGYISEGALVEKEVTVSYADLQRMDLLLKSPDFTTANKTAAAVNQALGGPYAQAVDGTTIRIEVPPAFRQQSVAMLTRIENLEIQPELIARVVINEKTGTIVMGESVRISPVAVAHGNLTVQITEKPAVSQPLPFSQGKTTVVPQTNIQVQEQKAALAVIGGGVSIGEVIQGLNAIGATPRDLVNILQAIRAAGALQADLDVM